MANCVALSTQGIYMWTPKPTPPGYKRKNELKIRPTPHDEREKFVMDQLDRILTAAAPDIGIDLKSKTKLHGHCHALIDAKLGVGGYEFIMAIKRPIKVLVEHQGLKAYRIRYQVPDFIFDRVIGEVHCTVDSLVQELKNQWEKYRQR